jgi:hypothetical protein
MDQSGGGMNAAIGRLLTDFHLSGGEKSAGKTKPAEKAPPKPAKREAAPAAPMKTDKSMKHLEEAYRHGYAAGVANVEAKIAEERVGFAVRLGEERAKWSDQQAVAIVAGITDACRQLEENIVGSLARILQPFLEDQIREKAIAALVDQISVLTSESAKAAFRIAGPADLLDAVKRRLDANGLTGGIEYEPADVAEVRLVSEQATIETQIQTWVGRLKQAGR